MAQTTSKPTSPGCLTGVAVVGMLLMIAMCSAPKDKAAESFVSPTLSNQIETMAAPTPAPIDPVNAASLRIGRRHLTAVMQAESLSGAMIYSQNCYDALSRAFSWTKLDQCGGFDMLAVKTVETADTDGLSSEVEYFGPEAAAGRYLALATKAGQAAEEADKRLEELQQRTAKLAPPATKLKPTPAANDTPVPDLENPLENDIDEEADV